MISREGGGAMGDDDISSAMSRRRFLQTSAAGAGLLWRPVRRVTGAAAGDRPPGFPRGVALYRRVFENWALEIRVEDLWSCEPRTPRDIVALADWAATNGWRLRPLGKQHGWAPFTVLPGTAKDAKVILVDTTRHLTAVSVERSHGGDAVTAQAGALMGDVMEKLEAAGLGFSSIPAPGEITVAGALAINGHGAALPGEGEDTAGRDYGSLSNRVLALRAVVWDEAAGRHKLRTFDRSEPDAKALLTHLGRAFITSVTMRAERGVNLRCVSRTDLAWAELFAAPDTPGARTFASFVKRTGRVEAILFPFTEKPWLKIWSVRPRKPASSREVTAPYNYPFSDRVPLPVARLARALVSGHGEFTPQFGQLCYDVAARGLVATDSSDIWGKAKNTQLYIRPSTLRAGELGYGILTRRADIQRVLHEFVAKYQSLLISYQERGLYPANLPIELRCTGLDDATLTGVAGAEPASLSASSPRPDAPAWDVIVWVNVLYLARTPGSPGFMRELEQWMLSNYSGDYATARPEWAKGWAYTNAGGWKDQRVLGDRIPIEYRAGRSSGDDWNWAIARLGELDPHRVFSNSFLDGLLQAAR